MSYVRELTFKSTNSKHFAEIHKRIKELQRGVKQKAMDKAKEELAEQEPLMIIKGLEKFLSSIKFI